MSLEKQGEKGSGKDVCLKLKETCPMEREKSEHLFTGKKRGGKGHSQHIRATVSSERIADIGCKGLRGISAGQGLQSEGTEP